MQIVKEYKWVAPIKNSRRISFEEKKGTDLLTLNIFVTAGIYSALAALATTLHLLLHADASTQARMVRTHACTPCHIEASKKGVHTRTGTDAMTHTNTQIGILVGNALIFLAKHLNEIHLK